MAANNRGHVSYKNDKMANLIDLTGQKFGKWTVLGKGTTTSKYHHPRWLCKCDCGNQHEVLGGALRSGLSLQCKKCSSLSSALLRRENLVGQQFNNWEVIEYDKTSYGTKATKWICKCKCGTIKSIPSTDLKSGYTTRCRTCYYQRTGPWEYLFRKLIDGAIQRNIDVKITIQDLKDLFIKQAGKCALSGRTLRLGIKNGMFLNTRKWSSENTVSIDRIDSSKDYILDNIQIIHKDINLMKLDYSQKDFIQICKDIAYHNK